MRAILLLITLSTGSFCLGAVPTGQRVKQERQQVEMTQVADEEVDDTLLDEEEVKPPLPPPGSPPVFISPRALQQETEVE